MEQEQKLALDTFFNYNRPLQCEACEGIMIFKGVGEYHCEKCGKVEFDDYGKARLYLESHRGANVSEISKETGVSQKNIRMMVKESRFEITTDSKVFFQCEICKRTIRSGRYCARCEQNVHKRIEDEERERKRSQSADVQVYGKAQQGEKGEKRFTR